MPYPRPRRAAALAAAVAISTLALSAAAPGPPAARAQSFTRVSDPANPIYADPGAIQPYTGASWIDYDGDGLPDLYVGRVGLYHNLGGGKFEKVASVQAPALTPQVADTWADYDNDGDPDLFVVASSGKLTGQKGSFLYRNDTTGGSPPGAGPFTKVLVGAMADSLGNGGWAAAWGDYDDDGRVDLAIAGLTGFATLASNHLLHNLGGDLFERDTTTEVDNFTAPFTVPTWSDFDQDGDVDLFVGSGPANGTLGPDYCFRNATRGAPGVTRLDRLDGPPFTSSRDGQVWNWIDYDNDGDLDVYITNYGGSSPGVANELWRNDGGALVRLTATDVGSIVGDLGLSLSSDWGDFDNDGDLDCLVTNAGNGRNRLYRNDVDSTGQFVAVTTGSSPGDLTYDLGTHVTACAADYDRDGRLDLFVSGATSLKNLYHNTTANGFHWAEFRLVGVSSNRSAIGARVHVRAVIKGQPRWQMREISAENTFNGQNELVAHFGLREAESIDSICIEWPSGLVEESGGGPADRLYTIVEGSLGATPTRLALAASRVTDAGTLVLTWAGELDPGMTATVERSEDAATWAERGALAGGTGGIWLFEDSEVAPGRRYAYRLAFADARGARGVSEAAWVDVPAAGGIAFGIRSAPPNPCRLGDGARFVLALAGPGGANAGEPARGAAAARFELVAANGRVAWGRAIAPVEAAAGSLTLDVPTAGLAPGIYWARLARGRASAQRKLVLVR